jgi:hypothetical protein
VDMTELLPGSWRSEEMDPLSKSLSRRPSVTEISVWMECFATLAALVSYRYPGKAPQLFAYCRTIVRASRNYEGLAWVAYDNAFRRQAAIRRSYEWGSIDPVLYNEAFTGRARIKTRCHHCLSDTHTSDECVSTPPRLVWASDSARPQGARQQIRRQPRQVQVCGLFNLAKGNSCSYQRCKYAHICSNCYLGPHPASRCDKAVQNSA